MGTNLPLSQYHDYVFTPNSTGATIDIKITATTGNPGLFIGWTPRPRYLNATVSTWRAGPGVLSWRITNTTIYSCAYTNRVVGVNCTYYISIMNYNSTVSGYANTSLNYVLTIGQPGEATELLSGNVRADDTLPARSASGPSIAYYVFRYTLAPHHDALHQHRTDAGAGRGRSVRQHAAQSGPEQLSVVVCDRGQRRSVDY